MDRRPCSHSILLKTIPSVMVEPGTGWAITPKSFVHDQPEWVEFVFR